jgi:EPS-associated MarR family transcriptional regulator
MSQRQLAQEMGVSVGKLNYCLKALVNVGMIKMGNFARSTHKLGYAYILTPSGIAEKSRVTTRFLARKEAEYEALKGEIEALRLESSGLEEAKMQPESGE